MSHIRWLSSSTCNDLNADEKEIVLRFDSFPQTFSHFYFCPAAISQHFHQTGQYQYLKWVHLEFSNFAGKIAYRCDIHVWIRHCLIPPTITTTKARTNQSSESHEPDVMVAPASSRRRSRSNSNVMQARASFFKLRPLLWWIILYCAPIHTFRLFLLRCTPERICTFLLLLNPSEQ